MCGERCAQYFVIAFCGYMYRDNICMYMTHVCFMYVVVTMWGYCGNVCCVLAVVEDIIFSLGVLKYVYVMGVAWNSRC